MKNLFLSPKLIGLITILPIIVGSGINGCTKKSVMVSQGEISGKITLAPLLERTPIQPTAALFLIARPAGQLSGPPIAVKRFTPPFHFPLEFKLSKEDAMIPNTPFEGSFDLTVRLAQTGSATPASAGDFEGEVPTGAVNAGSKDIEIRIAKVRP